MESEGDEIKSKLSSKRDRTLPWFNDEVFDPVTNEWNLSCALISWCKQPKVPSNSNITTVTKRVKRIEIFMI